MALGAIAAEHLAVHILVRTWELRSEILRAARKIGEEFR